MSETYQRPGREARLSLASLIAAAKRGFPEHLDVPCHGVDQVAADRKAVAGKIANLLRLAEKTPDSVAVAARLRELEEQQRELDEQIANAEQAAATRRALRATTRAEAQEMLTTWIQEDGTTLEEQRAALAQLVERIEFDPATGEGRMHYRIGVNGTRFRLDTAAADLGLGKPGYKWRPHGEPPQDPPSL